MGWRTLLEGGERDLALERATEIAAALGRADDLDDPSLAGGQAGAALVLDYLARAGVAVPDDAIDRRLGHAVDAVAERPLPAGLYSGFTGIAWVVERLAGEDADDDAGQEIDAALLEGLGQTPWTGDFDVVNGLAGLAVYALERLEHGRASGRALLERAIERLAETAVGLDAGATWWTDPRRMVAETRARSPRGHYDCGLAHGAPGVIAVLAASTAAGVHAALARPLLERAVSWLLAQRRAGVAGGQLPYWVGIPPAASTDAVRCAWCYGDPGAAAALYWAGQLCDQRAWMAAALDLARGAAARRDRDAGVVDAGLCHGAAGLALIFDRLWQASGDPALRDAARFWALRAVDLHQPGLGFAGYRSYAPRSGDDPERWRADASLLTGAAGVAAALCACASSEEPRWDRFLLTSARPPA